MEQSNNLKKVAHTSRYTAHELIEGTATHNAWSLALLEIYDSPRHIHTVEREIFIVVQGVLNIEVDSTQKRMHVGESITIQPDTVHKLTSADAQQPVKVLCVSFPAFDPHDMHCLE